MSDLTGIASLNNKYFILRHGQSEANVAGLTTSDPAVCISNYGLTEHGREQVATSIKEAQLKDWVNTKTIIYHSDFKRTAETAQLAQRLLNARKIHPHPALRERSFGAYHGKHTDRYIEIWPESAGDRRAQQQNGVESPAEILERLVTLIKQLEANYREQTILLVSHGDPLQVLQAAFAGLKPKQSRSLKYIEPGEVRELLLKPQ